MMFMTEKVRNSPLRNLLDLSVFCRYVKADHPAKHILSSSKYTVIFQLCRKNFFRTAFSDVLYVANLPNMNNKNTEIKSTVLKSPG